MAPRIIPTHDTPAPNYEIFPYLLTTMLETIFVSRTIIINGVYCMWKNKRAHMIHKKHILLPPPPPSLITQVYVYYVLLQLKLILCFYYQTLASIESNREKYIQINGLSDFFVHLVHAAHSVLTSVLEI